MPTLKVVSGRTTAEEFAFDESVTIGRATDCDVRVFDEAASRHHAVIQCEDGRWIAADNNSVNGLYVNGRRVERQALRTGDEVAVRNLTLLFLDDGATDRATVVSNRALRVESRIEPREAAKGGREEELLARLAALYRFHGILGEPRAKLCALIPTQLEETFAPARAALILPDGDRGRYSSTVVEQARSSGEAILVSGGTGASDEPVVSAMAAPLDDFGAIYVDRLESTPFTKSDLELLGSIASAATPALRPASARAKRAGSSDRMLGESKAIQSLLGEIERVAPSDATVLISGETGTGKELVARALHTRSPRSRGPFVAVNCAAFVDTLLEAELFGHEKGAFTGADRQRIGRFEQAHKGTIFLDEVGELAAPLQAKLLRVLETREFHRVGATKTTRVDVRIVAASNRDLRAEGFREDLYFRLGVVTLLCPPLRDRDGDVDLLARHFLRDHTFTDAALSKLREYPWPGNVRELRNVCERCSVMADGPVIDVDELPLEVRLGRADTPDRDKLLTLKEMEKEMVARALDATGGNRTKAAALLGITYPTLKKKIDAFGL